MLRLGETGRFAVRTSVRTPQFEEECVDRFEEQQTLNTRKLLSQLEVSINNIHSSKLASTLAIFK